MSFDLIFLYAMEGIMGVFIFGLGGLIIGRFIFVKCVLFSRTWHFRRLMHKYYGWEYVSFEVGYGDGRRTERLKHDIKGRAYVRYFNREWKVYKGYAVDGDLRNLKMELGKL